MLIRSHGLMRRSVLRLGRNFGWFSSKEQVVEAIPQVDVTVVPGPVSTVTISPTIPAFDLPVVPIKSKVIEDLRAEANTFHGWTTDPSDMVNAVGTLKPNPTSDIPGIFTQLFSLSPTSLYEDVDTFTRDATLYMSQELGWGMGWAIFAMSVGLKLIFLPLQAAAQLQSVKMRLISKETKAFQERTKLLAKKGDYEAMKEEREKFSELRRSHGISTFIPLLGLVQVPFLITWFVSLRYMTMNPDLFPGMLTDGFLWFKNLSDYDPYFVLPFLSATFSAMNIARSPAANSSASSTNPIGKYIKFMKIVPFVGFPILMFFPAGMNLYWVTVASIHLMITLVIRSATFKKRYGLENILKDKRMQSVQHLRQDLEVSSDITIIPKEPKSDSQGHQVKEKKAEVIQPIGQPPKHTHVQEVDGKIEAKRKDKKPIIVFTNQPKKPKN